MWKEFLEDLAKDHPFIKPNPPATLDCIADAETKLGISFPQELKQCLMEVDGDGDALFSVQKIIDISAIMNEIYGKNNLLQIATNGCGDYFGYQVINKEISGTNIYMWDHEIDELTLVASNLKEIIAKHYHDEI